MQYYLEGDFPISLRNIVEKKSGTGGKHRPSRALWFPMYSLRCRFMNKLGGSPTSLSYLKFKFSGCLTGGLPYFFRNKVEKK